MIRHTVMFRLRHPAGSAAERSFLDDARVLATIPGVERFERLRQVNQTNDHAFTFSMEFADQADYDAYSDHPVHRAFVTERWVPEVERALEADFIAL